MEDLQLFALTEWQTAALIRALSGETVAKGPTERHEASILLEMLNEHLEDSYEREAQ